jgi:hypothetical protein
MSDKQTTNLVGQYRGYNIWRNVRTVSRSNPASGHQWTENVLARGFYVGGGKGISVEEIFRNVKAAKGKIDFVLDHSCGVIAAPGKEEFEDNL